MTTARIDQIHVVANQFAENIQQQIRFLSDTASEVLLFWTLAIGVLFLAGFTCSLLIARRFAKRIGDLNLALRHIEEHRDLTHRIAVTGSDEITLVKQAFNRLIEQLYEHEQENGRQQKALKKLVTDLETKQSIIDKDEELAKQVFAKITQAGGSEPSNIYSWNKPMTGFSGDLMLSITSDNGFTYVMMCDFTGHGLPAALGAVSVSSVFYSMAKKDKTIRDIVLEINSKLLTLLPTSYFCCAAILLFDHKLRTCAYWNGGLPPFLQCSQAGFLKATLSGESLPLGITQYSEDDCTSREVVLVPGDSLYVYTDGLTEADNRLGEMFDYTRLRKALTVPRNGASRICARARLCREIY